MGLFTQDVSLPRPGKQEKLSLTELRYSSSSTTPVYTNSSSVNRTVILRSVRGEPLRLPSLLCSLTTATDQTSC